MKKHLNFLIAVFLIVVVLLSVRAYQSYNTMNDRVKDIAFSNSNSLTSLVKLYQMSYSNFIKHKAEKQLEIKYFNMAKEIGDEVFDSFSQYSSTQAKIKVIKPSHIKAQDIEVDEKEAIVFLQDETDAFCYLDEIDFGRYLYVAPLDTYNKKAEKEQSYIVIRIDNTELKAKLYNEYMIEILGNILFTLAIFGLFYFTMKESQKKDERYLAKLEKEVAKKTKDIEEKNKRITFQLLNDELTQMPNRSQLIVDLSEVYHTEISLALINIDNFKEINDFYGHEIGDEVLQSFAEFLKLSTKDFTCKAYKLHSDEYALLWNDNNKQKKIEYVDKLTESIKDFIVMTEDDYSIEVTATIGLAVGTENILSRADMVLKRAKKEQLPYLVFEDYMEIEKEYKNNITWTKKLKQAIKDDKLVPFCQPIAYTKDKSISKYEILVRMIDEDDKIISPYYFLPIAKKNKLYSHVTTSVIGKTFKKFNNLPYSFSINLSILDILDEETVTFILTQLESYKNPELITFELLESEGIENYKQVLEFIDKIKLLGCKIAIDDFGSGYSNFEYMLNLKVDLIKIDASLIKNIDTSSNAQVIVTTIISFAKNLGIETCAEFVHSQAVYDKLVSLGVTYVQGYYISEPYPLENLEKN